MSVTIPSLVGTTAIEMDWDGFKSFMERDHRPATVRQQLFYVRKFHHLITTPEGPSRLGELLQLNEGGRLDTMKGLANLARFLGVYEQWKQLKSRYDLRWTRFSAEADASFFENIFYDNKKGLKSMIKWVVELREKLPEEDRTVLDFMVLTGLRPDEACKSLELLKTSRSTKSTQSNERSSSGPPVSAGWV